VPDLSGRELLGEWRKLMDSMVASAGSMGGRAEIPRQLLEPMQRQVELLQEVIERERAIQRQVAGRLLAPVDAIFDLVEESGHVLRQQAEALEAAGQALEDTARLVKTQAELFERVVGALREPTELAKVAAGLERRPPKRAGRQPARRRKAR
jgi:phage gpG-like protein